MATANSFHIKEYGVIFPVDGSTTKPHSDFENNIVYLGRKDFGQLVSLFKRHQANKGLDDPPMSHIMHAGKAGIRLSSYVGVVSLPSGTSIEIYPKITSKTGNLDQQKSKQLLLKMLVCLRSFPFRNIGSGDLSAIKDFPLLEIYISSFIAQCQDLLRNKMRSGYREQGKNDVYIRGKLHVPNNIKYNLFRKDRFWIFNTEYTRDIPQNRVIKAALKTLASKTRSKRSHSDLQALMQQMEDVSDIADFESDMRFADIPNRLFRHYSKVLASAKIFLQGLSFAPFKGLSYNLSLLHPMQSVFQNYVAEKFKIHTQYDVTAQHQECHLVEDHGGRRMFKLKPDLFIRDVNLTAVIDAKWKLLVETGRGNYKIKESDMYQMFAYAIKYSCKFNINNKDVPGRREMHFAFIYPAHDSFRNVLKPFYFFENGLHVKCIPFDLLEDPRMEIEKTLRILQQ